MDELVRCLRHCVDAPEHRACGANCKYGKEHPVNHLCIPVMMQEAADAIEQLNADLERSKEWETFWEKEANEALKKFQTAVANKPRWIPTTEQLPEDLTRVIVFCEDGVSYGLCEHLIADDEEVVEWHDFLHYPITPTHWMPLPEPPKEET